MVVITFHFPVKAKEDSERHFGNTFLRLSHQYRVQVSDYYAVMSCTVLYSSSLFNSFSSFLYYLLCLCLSATGSVFSYSLSLSLPFCHPLSLFVLLTLSLTHTHTLSLFFSPSFSFFFSLCPFLLPLFQQGT